MGGLICWNCGQSTGIEGKVMRSDSCEKCLADQRCCRGCRFFDPMSRAQCREHIDVPIPNKEKSNFCDYFQVRAAVQSGGKIIRDIESKDERKKKFDDLFKD
jgi:hypothetical protein